MNEVDFAQLRNYFGSGYPQVKVLEYQSDDQPTYVGFGTRGQDLTAPAWKVVRYTYIVGNQGGFILDTVKTSPDNSIASNYLTLEYE